MTATRQIPDNQRYKIEVRRADQIRRVSRRRAAAPDRAPARRAAVPPPGRHQPSSGGQLVAQPGHRHAQHAPEHILLAAHVPHAGQSSQANRHADCADTERATMRIADHNAGRARRSARPVARADARADAIRVFRQQQHPLLAVAPYVRMIDTRVCQREAQAGAAQSTPHRASARCASIRAKSARPAVDPCVLYAPHLCARRRRHST